MRYVAAYLLANLAGNESPDVKALEKILSSVGIECDKDKASKVLSELKGKDIAELIKNGQLKLASVPSGAPAAAAPAAGAPAAKKDEPSRCPHSVVTTVDAFAVGVLAGLRTCKASTTRMIATRAWPIEYSLKS
jgi:large subunit ribosomal protein LP2